jgi:transcriptional regulator with XRE-family HTH domain
MTITAAQLKTARQLLGWSQDDVAAACGAARPVSDTAIDQLRLALEAGGAIFMVGSKSGVELATEAAMTVTGAQVKAARDLLGWSQIKLTLASGIDGGAIRRFETGKRLPPRAVGLTLSRTLKSAGVIFTAENGDGPGVKLRKGK